MDEKKELKLKGYIHCVNFTGGLFNRQYYAVVEFDSLPLVISQKEYDALKNKPLESFPIHLKGKLELSLIKTEKDKLF